MGLRSLTWCGNLWQLHTDGAPEPDLVWQPLAGYTQMGLRSLTWCGNLWLATQMGLRSLTWPLDHTGRMHWQDALAG